MLNEENLVNILQKQAPPLLLPKRQAKLSMPLPIKDHLAQLYLSKHKIRWYKWSQESSQQNKKNSGHKKGLWGKHLRDSCIKINFVPTFLLLGELGGGVSNLWLEMLGLINS